jgi:hypothetical protein
MKFYVCLALLMFTTISFAQSRKERDRALTDTTWHEGAIIKADGTKEGGLVRYNDALGLVNFNDAHHEQYAFGPTRVAGFEYFDKSINKWRYFLSIDNYNQQKKETALDFHELIMEFETFTVWSKVEPIFLKKERNFSPGDPVSGTMPGMSTTESMTRTEIIYLMNPKTDKFHAIMKLETMEDGKKLPDDPSTDKRGTIDFNILEELFGQERVSQLKAFAKENDLNWRRKEDLLVILEEAGRL